jgi:serine/threonine protein kinase
MTKKSDRGEENLLIVTRSGEHRIRRPRITREVLAATLGIEAYGYTLAESKRKGYISMVYEAIHIDTNERVALKFPQDKEYRRNSEGIFRLFKEEAELLQELDHPNLVRGRGFFDHLGIPFIVMEYLPELFLDVFDKNPTEDAAYSFMLQATEAVCYLHSRGRVHYDIKPVQFMVDNEGTLKLIDLGSVRYDGAEMTEAFQMTPGYVYLPDVRDGRMFYEKAADMYALGKTFASIMLRTAGMDGREISKIIRAMDDKGVKQLEQMMAEGRPESGDVLRQCKEKSDRDCIDVLKGNKMHPYFINDIVARCLDPKAGEKEFTAPVLMSSLLEYDRKRKRGSWLDAARGLYDRLRRK